MKPKSKTPKSRIQLQSNNSKRKGIRCISIPAETCYCKPAIWDQCPRRGRHHQPKPQPEAPHRRRRGGGDMDVIKKKKP